MTFETFVWNNTSLSFYLNLNFCFWRILRNLNSTFFKFGSSMICFTSPILITTMGRRRTHLTLVLLLITVFTVYFTFRSFWVLITLTFKILFLKLRNLLCESIQFIFCEKISMNKLIWGSRRFKIFIIHMTSSWWINASIIHIFISLKFI